MPHTPQSRKKKGIKSQKRIAVTDNDGWTHVTTGGNLKRTLWKAAAAATRDNDDEQSPAQLLPAEAPRGLTIDELKNQYLTFREKWESSTSWHAVRDSLRAIASASAAASALSSPSVRPDVITTTTTINIICLGLGSPSGFLRGGWVDRRNVSMYQLAALTSILNFFDSHSEVIPRVYAQDPVFNTLDKSLLDSLGITVIEHPTAFDMVRDQRENENERVFLFCPGAERIHIEKLLSLSRLSSWPSGPDVLFGGPLEEHDDSELLTTFLDTRDSARIPVFEPCEHAFWNMRLYWIRDL
ncbi:hypothetical protein MPDQ_000775 [Monascus purpureus]|uniref:SRR1-like domain-containing protein n=1 Tax=Monascus purpureus TaxID=5098 RepID=A0A507QT49_MONPU|nr:hypothetical protein MPDQ_000775 [Monascus purpureus]BDD59581.1 hypothetical protein MAP00_004776 [Monascus purpureus]